MSTYRIVIGGELSELAVYALIGGAGAAHDDGRTIVRARLDTQADLIAFVSRVDELGLHLVELRAEHGS
ncbi:hypothetical protein [Gordonia sp. NB41Y]|uniref:hypothetical protein n=1 Tax=Gordonia sp. NB41Y TaxID=875808 RepID=UPI0002C01CC2|nr:hypothetical protein [Gordonia sp. NB41Y]EMP14480.1 hypothetical protein ISGA_6 [Gordonia sp. NB41Y]WLP92568.1 hypothetical protein Q9K23_10235 [Gordonia sp. NB41Y]